MKKILSFVLALVMVVCLLASCGNKPAGEEGVNQYKIGVALYTDSGKSVDAIKAFLAGISQKVGCTFVYETLSTYDESINLTKVQNLISSGCNGIILTADQGTAAIVEECEEAGVYLAGFLCDFRYSNYVTHDAVFGSDYFLGTVCDGWADASSYGEMVAEKVIAGGYKNIGVFIFPDYAYPNQKQVSNKFREKIAEYNATAAEANKITVYEDQVLQFEEMDSTYLTEHPQLDCIFSIAAGVDNVYPVLVANNKTNIKLFTTGFEGTEDVQNFGTSGNGCFQGTLFSAPEAIVYPLVLIIDALNNDQYADLPAAEVVDCQPLVVLSQEDMAAVVANSLYYSTNSANALITGEQVKNLCHSYNSDATYAQLIAFLATLGVDSLK